MKKITDILIFLAVVAITLMTGGLKWQQCIIPLFCLGGALLCARRQTNGWGLVISVCIFLAYGLSLFKTGGNFQNGIYETEKFLLFPLGLALGTAVRKKTVQYSVYTAALLVAVVGLVAYCGFSGISDFVINSGGILRLQSLLRYANTTACLLGVGYIISTSLYDETQKKLHLYLSSVLLLAMFLTVSKAAIPMFVAVLTLILFKKKNNAFQNVFQILITALFFVPIMLLSKKYLYFPSAALMVIFVFVSAIDIKFLQNKSVLKIWLAVLLAGLVGGILLINLKPSLFSTFVQRFIYTKDALKLVFPKILFGWGAGSWKVLQYQIQSTQYDVTYIHNGFMQFLFENGIVFTVGFVSLCICAFVGAFKKKNYDFAAAILLICIHSILDFDLSYGIMLIILGLLCGNSINFETKKLNGFVAPTIFAVFAAIIAISAVYMTSEYILRDNFENLCLENKYSEALARTEKLEKLCPKDSSLKMNIAALNEKTEGNEEFIKTKINEAKKLSPHDPDVFKGYAIYNTTRDNIESLCKEYIDMKPKHEKTYTDAKKIVENACEMGIIDQNEKNNIITQIDEIRFNNKVYDRNELLDRIMKERGSKK